MTGAELFNFFKAADSAVISPNERADVARKLADASSGWNAVAVGTQGRPGLGLKAATEQAVVNGALADCVKRDSDCHIIAIGPSSVGSKQDSACRRPSPVDLGVGKSRESGGRSTFDRWPAA